MYKGHVTIIGAGPGDPDLLTRKGYRYLQTAGVIFYDSLISDGFKEIFPKGVPHFHVGKRCKNHTLPQREIEQQLIKWAQAGYHVVRLKGGDPFIYGRGGEEVEALIQAGLDFQIIPGLSSLNGVASQIHMPLTHRQVTRKFMVVEGHTLGQGKGDFEQLANFEGTLAIFMGARKTRNIARELLAAGANPDLKLMLVETDARMQTHPQVHTLARAAAGECGKKTSGPGILYIGRTIDLFQRWKQSIASRQGGPRHEQAVAAIF